MRRVVCTTATPRGAAPPHATADSPTEPARPSAARSRDAGRLASCATPRQRGARGSATVIEVAVREQGRAHRAVARPVSRSMTAFQTWPQPVSVLGSHTLVRARSVPPSPPRDRHRQPATEIRRRSLPNLTRQEDQGWASAESEEGDSIEGSERTITRATQERQGRPPRAPADPRCGIHGDRGAVASPTAGPIGRCGARGPRSAKRVGASVVVTCGPLTTRVWRDLAMRPRHRQRRPSLQSSRRSASTAPTRRIRAWRAGKSRRRRRWPGGLR